MKKFARFTPHILALVGFVCISLLYFYPVLQGKKIFQSDIVQYTGMAKEQNDFRDQENIEPYWTNSAFGGMPTYQLGAKYPHDYIGALDDALRFLPRPADYLFLYFLGFYILLMVMKVEPLTAFFGALAFGFSTYLIIILGVGHNAKAHAIAYMPMVLAGVILVFRQRYIWGGILTMVAAALEINTNHFQMTYYLMILLAVIVIYFVYQNIKEKQPRDLLYAFGIFAVAGILAIGANATNLLATAEYSKFSTRDKSELKYEPDGKLKVSDNAMSRDYITEYSYGIAESFNLIAPRLFGGSNHENLGTDSSMYEFMISKGVPDDQARDFATTLPTYWGDQPIVAAPAYIGAIVFLLTMLALFLDKRKIKYAFLTGAIVSLLLSWGKNLGFLTDFFIDFVPLYNKFRAVSSIQVILELCLPILAIMGLETFFRTQAKEIRWKALWKSTAVVIGILAILAVFKSSFSFSGANDDYYAQSYGPDFVAALTKDRKSMYMATLLRSGFMVAVAFGLLWFYNNGKLSRKMSLILVGLLMVTDLFLVDKNYVSADDFKMASAIDAPFQATESDMQISHDTTHYRVFEISGNLSSARASYFHSSIGGYHAAKPRRMQQLFDYQIAGNNSEVLHMLNVKYIIQTDKEGKEFPTMNPGANGNAWFVQNIQKVHSSDEEINALADFDSRKTAVINTAEFPLKIDQGNISTDTTASIAATFYKPNKIKYQSKNTADGLAVFSEIYYKNGWNAYIDGKNADVIRTDYLLRGLFVPKGNHEIVFKFEPTVVKTGSTITLISCILMLLVILGAGYYSRRQQWFAAPSET